ncbi:hypothetical protein, partial [Kitasatospora aureofaciens]|uniref:hypothetical protein n=1 Tax=Kitasatospora aureofaciens TaxID=1894 RepID=UPI0034094016
MERAPPNPVPSPVLPELTLQELLQELECVSALIRPVSAAAGAAAPGWATTTVYFHNRCDKAHYIKIVWKWSGLKA